MKTLGYFAVFLVNLIIASDVTSKEILDNKVIAEVMKVPVGTCTVPPPRSWQSLIASSNAFIFASTVVVGASTSSLPLCRAP